MLQTLLKISNIIFFFTKLNLQKFKLQKVLLLEFFFSSLSHD